MIRQLLEKLPFVHHHLPVNLPLRKAVVLCLKRPVELNKIQQIITKQLESKGIKGIDDIEVALNYLKKNRMGKNDSGNFFVASLRSLAKWDLELSISFGIENVKTLPDKRAINTLITNLMRLERNEEAFSLLELVRKDITLKHRRNQILQSLKRNKGIPNIEDCTFLFDFKERQRLSKSPVYFNCPVVSKRTNLNIDLQDYSFDLTGSMDIGKNEADSSVIAIFEFFNESGEKIEFSRIEGLTNSKNVGWYSYLRQDEKGFFAISIDLNVEVSAIRLGFRTWHAKSPVYIRPDIELKRSSYAEISLEFEQFLSNINIGGYNKLVFIFSGTTFVQEIKANRPIHLAKEYIKRGIPVIFSYHRWRKSEAIPEYNGDLLFQMPIDITSKMFSKLSEIDSAQEKIFYISYPHPAVPKILNRFKVNSWKVIYDARDDWDEFNKVNQAKWYKQYNEKYIINNSCIVTAVSQPLVDKLTEYSLANKIHLSPNALRDDFVMKTYKLKQSDQIKVGYFGHLTDSWFDWKSLIKIARKRTDYIFEIIGHSEPKDLQLPENIVLLGPKTHIEINEIACYWKVAIIPFKISKLSEAVDPIKIYEYLALDLPVVSFEMPQIKSYPNTLTVKSIDEFCEGLDEFIRNKPPSNVSRKWLTKNTWSKRVNHYDELISQQKDDDIFALVRT